MSSSLKPIGGAAVVLALLLVGGCAKPLLEYHQETPPLILRPALQAGVIDGRARFREIFCALTADHGADLPDHRPCEDSLNRLQGEPEGERKPVVLGPSLPDLHAFVVPGVIAECFEDKALPLVDAIEHVRGLGYEASVLKVGGLTSSRQNAAQVRDAVLALEPGKRAILIGYSKGLPDSLEALALYPEIVPRVAAVVSLAGVVNGSPLAETASKDTLKLIRRFGSTECPEGDLGGIDSLRRQERIDWLVANELPDDVRYYTLGAFAERERISAILRGSYDKMAFIDPRNDSQVLFYDQVIPGSVLLGYLHADHWAVAIPIARTQETIGNLFVTRNAFPREIMLEALLKAIEEDLEARTVPETQPVAEIRGAGVSS